MTKVVIAGGTGHLGSLLTERFVKEDGKTNVIVLTRRIPIKRYPLVSYVLWDGKNVGEWVKVLEAADVLINLCGRSVNCRYTEINKKRLVASRVESTEILGKAIQGCAAPPKVWINASSAASYGFSDIALDESAPPGVDFPSELCKKWEGSFYTHPLDDTRRLTLRLAVVLQRRRGLILPFMRLARYFVGGPQGSGKQYFTWIHEEDFFKGIKWLINNPNASGVYNVTAPEPVVNAEFMAALRKAMKIPFGLPIPSFLIHIGGKIIGTEPYLVLKGRKVLPVRLLEEGYEFDFPKIEVALENLVGVKTSA